MEAGQPTPPPELVRGAIQKILSCFWDMVLDDFQARLVEQPHACHTEHLFVSFVDLAGWLKNQEIYPMDFVVVERDRHVDIDLTEEDI